MRLISMTMDHDIELPPLLFDIVLEEYEQRTIIDILPPSRSASINASSIQRRRTIWRSLTAVVALVVGVVILSVEWSYHHAGGNGSSQNLVIKSPNNSADTMIEESSMMLSHLDQLDNAVDIIEATRKSGKHVMSQC